MRVPNLGRRQRLTDPGQEGGGNWAGQPATNGVVREGPAAGRSI